MEETEIIEGEVVEVQVRLFPYDKVDPTHACVYIPCTVYLSYTYIHTYIHARFIYRTHTCVSMDGMVCLVVDEARLGCLYVYMRTYRWNVYT